MTTPTAKQLVDRILANAEQRKTTRLSVVDTLVLSSLLRLTNSALVASFLDDEQKRLEAEHERLDREALSCANASAGARQ